MIYYFNNYDLMPIIYTNEFGQKCVEQWTDVVGCEGVYKVSNLGRILSLKRRGNISDKIMTQTPNHKGYLTCHLSYKGKSNTRSVHRMVAKAFIPNPLDLPQVNHCGKFPDGREGNKLDNRVISLKWSTEENNKNHAVENGLCKGSKGEAHGYSKLTDVKVLEIRAKHKFRVYTSKMLAEEYGVSNSTIKRILRRVLWNHI